MCARETQESDTTGGLSKPETKCVCSAKGGVAAALRADGGFCTIGGRASGSTYGAEVWGEVGASFGSSGDLCDTNWAGWLGVAICSREMEESDTTDGLSEPETECVCSAKDVALYVVRIGFATPVFFSGRSALRAAVWENFQARFGSSADLCTTSWAGWLGPTLCAREAEESTKKNVLSEPKTEHGYVCECVQILAVAV
ncbi:uncharacterized protein EMH_0016530 [Eimeria mitis]|uniref:Uncharacterized protein n=1 Tax=Eimeria mitis TaxID=44415 RepID=U6KEG9_9EIME|nr:uncharacterized protein EMH_0016530 [Eimeria mitis]CDJ36410.1 hypothetical protein EMH_0016530 [Eimeria mitis]